MSVLENNLVLVPVIEKQTGLVSLKNYEGLLEQVKKFAENNYQTIMQRLRLF